MTKVIIFVVHFSDLSKAMQDGEQIFVGGCTLPHFYLDARSIKGYTKTQIQIQKYNYTNTNAKY